ncbi:hypothetical protein [Pseudomonas sp. DNDY-54]|uniref:hypothetical protein n=1 Tax=Pseudomonas sp. DNDY-54 TaxID=2870860 RepID=UPI001CA40C64|nr:hypothetical protein [Pseudomonas sp. DNDY-54]
MAYFFDMLFGLIFVFVASLGLIITPLKKYVSLKIVVVAIFMSPLVLLVTSLCVSQVDAVGVEGFLAGDFLCSSLHGASSHGCGIGGALFDAFLVAGLFSLVSFGLFPIAAFVVSLLLLSILKKLLCH